MVESVLFRSCGVGKTGSNTFELTQLKSCAALLEHLHLCRKHEIPEWANGRHWKKSWKSSRKVWPGNPRNVLKSSNSSYGQNGLVVRDEDRNRSRRWKYQAHRVPTAHQREKGRPYPPCCEHVGFMVSLFRHRGGSGVDHGLTFISKARARIRCDCLPINDTDALRPDHRSSQRPDRHVDAVRDAVDEHIGIGMPLRLMSLFSKNHVSGR